MVNVRAKTEGGLTSVELLTRGLLIYLEHTLNFLPFPDRGSSKYQVIVSEKKMGDSGSPSWGSHPFERLVLDSLIQ